MKKKPVKAGKKEKEIEKIVEDKTFGQKNKNKSKHVEQLKKTIAGQERGGYEKLKNEIFDEKKKKKAEEEEKKLMVDIFAKTAPKSQATAEDEKKICQLFKAGLCTKGKKCKFIHEGKEPPKSDKIDLFTDQRDQIFAQDNINTWNQTKLEEAVNYNESKYVNPAKTEKTCKHFLEAVEKKTYGWLWVCPNGYNCVFRHALPPDYVFKQPVVIEEKKEEKDIVEIIDQEREKFLGVELPKVTEAQFKDWVKLRRERIAKEREERIKEDKKHLGHKNKSDLTGKELFNQKQELFKDDDEAVDAYEREVVVEEEKEDEDKKDASEHEEEETEKKEKVEIDEAIFKDEEIPDV